MGSDDDSTHEINVAALRAAAQATKPVEPVVAAPKPRPADDDGAPTLMGYVRVDDDGAPTLYGRVAPPVPSASAPVTRPMPVIDDAALTLALPVRVDDAFATIQTFVPPEEIEEDVEELEAEAPHELPAYTLEDSGESPAAPEPDAFAGLDRAIRASSPPISVARPAMTTITQPTLVRPAPASVRGEATTEEVPTMAVPVAAPVRDPSEAETLMRPATAAMLEFVASLPPLSSRATKPPVPVTEDVVADDLVAAEELVDEADVVPAGESDALPVAEVSASELEVIEDDERAGAFPSITKTDEIALLPSDELDGDEERALFEAERYGELVALYRQRLGENDAPTRKTALLLRIARVYEAGLGDARSAFDAISEAFELTPEEPEVVAEVDRLGRATNRLGELSDRIRKKVLPKTPDERRGLYLGHIVYWYERVLGRGRDVGPLVADLERHDKLHPVVLKRAAQLAGMNGDVKTQREHLLRALERTMRRDERATLHIALGEAYAGTADELKQYELALENDPTSLAALQAIKRLAREKENHELVRSALERLVDAVPTDGARVEALLELAELEESKFLRRESAAELLERVLELVPGQATALKGLERCYHALRDWPNLARVLALRAERTSDKKAKAELLSLAAEVYDTKIGNTAAAVEAYRNVLLLDPKSKRALGDLAKLYEKLGDWTNVAAYKVRLAELAPTKRAMAAELVKVGDYLDLPDRDRIAARLQYERSVVIDPANVAGWEALQRIAAESGDERRLVECLEKRRDHTDVPRQRAVVLAELGRVHLKRGDQDESRKAFEAAIRADPANEAAAAVMLDIYTAESRWAEAAPLAELLVNAAIRDRDSDALFVRLRLATRISAALGDADRAMLSAVGALDARPDDPGAQADLVVFASQCRESAPAAIAKGRAHLAAIALAPDALSPENVLRLAALQRDANDLESAAALLERAQGLLPDDANVARDLAEVYAAQGDFARACRLKLELARNAPDADLRFDLLCEAGEIWARRAGELERAVGVFEEARALKPRDPWVLQTLRWLYGELDAFAPLAGVLEHLAETQEPAERVQTLTLLAELFREKLDDLPRAVETYEQVLDADPKRLELFEEIGRILTEQKAWSLLEASYRRMLERVRGGEPQPELELLLLQQLGLIYRDRIGDAERAYEALDAASRVRPDDAEARRMVIELLVATDNLDAAVARLREDVDKYPENPDLYAELYELFLRQSAFDEAWCALNVLSEMRDLTEEQQGFLDDYAPMPLENVPGQIVEQAWLSHLLHPELDPRLTRLFQLITPVVARIRLAQLKPEQRVGRPFTPKHSRLHDAVRATFENAAEILALPAPDLLLGDASAAPFAPALAPYGAVQVNAAAVEARPSALAFLVGRCLAEQRPELAARGFFPSVPELSSLLATAVRVARNEPANDPASAALDQSFAATVDEDELAALRNVVLSMSPVEASRLDVKAWLRAAEHSITRAGLLVAGDIGPVSDVIAGEPAPPGPAGELVRRERMHELYKFAVSDQYAELRTAIGVAVEA